VGSDFTDCRDYRRPAEGVSSSSIMRASVGIETTCMLCESWANRQFPQNGSSLCLIWRTAAGIVFLQPNLALCEFHIGEKLKIQRVCLSHIAVVHKLWPSSNHVGLPSICKDVLDEPTSQLADTGKTRSPFGETPRTSKAFDHMARSLSAARHSGRSCTLGKDTD
jgi:hypothetical protein